jgi:hypothetical protein
VEGYGAVQAVNVYGRRTASGLFVAASGVNPNTGSALSVRSSAAETGELDALTIRYNANQTARNLQYQGAIYGSQASLDASQASWAVGNSILSGASSVSDKWLKYNQMGVMGFGNTPTNPIMAGSFGGMD